MSKIQASTIQKRHLETIKTRKKHDYPSSLTDELLLQIIDCVKDGLDSRKTALKLKISEKTLSVWKHRNVKELSNLWRKSELEYMLLQAEKKMDELMSLDFKGISGNGREYIDTRLLAIQQREAEFKRSFLVNAKKDYASKDVTVNVQVNLPSPILDIGKLDTTD